MDANFERKTDPELNTLLEGFYSEVCQQDGTPYSKNSLLGIRSAITRHLNCPPFKRNVQLSHSDAYSTSNRMLFAVFKDLRGQGLDLTKNKDIITNQDMKVLLNEQSFDTRSPSQLQEKVFFDIIHYGGRRGRENLRSLKKDSFVFGSEETSREYAELAHNEHTKNHHTMNEAPQSKPCIYETHKPNCPVLSLKKYISKLNPTATFLFCRPITHRNFQAQFEDTCFTEQVIGIHLLGNLMKRISRR